ncbi:FAD binding domain-containing protein [Apiospora saccharicola]
MAPDFAPLRKRVIRGQVLTPGDDGYEESLLRWSTTCIKRAAVVVKPADAQEASQAVQFATSHALPLTVRGGGHSPSGASASEGGMVVDLGLMRSVSVDTVGGLILGGGFGQLTGRHGLSIDVLLRCEVVLANGEVVTASDTENPDLFWALRGAGHSFGVVTSFTSRIFPQGMAWGGVLVLPITALPNLVSFINEFCDKNDGDQAMMPMLTCHPATLEPCVAGTMFFNGPQEAAEALYAPLLKLDSIMNTTAAIPYPVANTFPNPKAPPGKRYLFSGANFVPPLDLAFVQKVSDRFHAALAPEGNREIRAGSMVAFELIPHGKISAVDGAATAFAGRDGKAFNIIINMAWHSPEKDGEARRICSELTHFLKDRGWRGDEAGDRGGTYLNYLIPATEEDKVFTRADRVFGPNIQRLRELKVKYDPNNVFKKAVNLLPTENGNSNVNTNGKTNGNTNGHINGHANEHANGHTNGHANGNTDWHANGKEIGEQ